MIITSKAEYEAAAERANAISDAPEGSPAASELAALVEALRKWDEEHTGENRNGPENSDVGTALTKDDLPISGLPGNLGKLNAE